MKSEDMRQLEKAWDQLSKMPARHAEETLEAIQAYNHYRSRCDHKMPDKTSAVEIQMAFESCSICGTKFPKRS